MRDLDDVIRRSLDERAARLGPAVPSPAALAATVAGVRRRRRVRHTAEAFGGVGAVGVLVLAMALGGVHGRPAPAETPTPLPSASASATPTPSSTPTPSEVATPDPTPDPTPTEAPVPSKAQVDAGLGLPATVDAPAGIWQKVGAGWSLGIYRPYWATRDSSPQLRNTLVLASPTGVTYRLRELPADVDVTLVRWDPGTTRALVTIAPVHDGVTGIAVRGRLDLRTGRLTHDPGAVGKPDSTGLAPDIWFVGLDHRGDELWFATYGLTGGGGPATLIVQRPDGALVHRVDLRGDDVAWASALVDPSGRRLVLPGVDGSEATYEVVDLDTGRETTHAYGVAERYCQVVGWRTAGELLTRCRRDSWESTGFDEHLQSAGDRLYVVSVGAGAPRAVHTLAVGDPAVPLWDGLTLPRGRVVVGAIPVGTEDDGECVAGLYALDGGRATALGVDGVVRVHPSGAVGRRIYAVTETRCDPAEQQGVQLESLDGTTRTALLRRPASTDPQLGGGLDSWVVAGGPSGRAWG